MKKFFKSTILGLTLGILLAGYMAFWTFNQNENFPAEVKAGVTDNVSGYAWSENVGWVSFNCTDQGTCGSVDYGVHIDNLTGVFSGFAWSENIGWIKFDPAGPYPTDPPTDDFSAELNLSSNKVFGWARACAGAANPDCTGGTNPESGGWDGWIKTRSTSPDYQVTYNPSTKEFNGFAWGSDVVGWLSFNCADLGVCDSSNYKVIGDIDSAPSVSPDIPTPGDYCSIPSHSFSWTFVDPGDSQTAYQLQIDDSSTFASMPENGGTPDSWDLDTGKVPSGSPSKLVLVSPAPSTENIGYNRTYSWRIKVWDEGDNASVWEVGTFFDTEDHRYPDSDFTFTPTNPSEGEEITFTQSAVCYDITNFVITCPTSASNYSWDFDYETPPFTQNTTGQSATTTYNDTSAHIVALNATDADTNTCLGTDTVSPKSPLPKFKETAPSS